MWGWIQRYRTQKAMVIPQTAEAHCEQLRQDLRQLRADLVVLHDELEMATDDIDSLLRRMARRTATPEPSSLAPMVLTAAHHQR
jgi:hypothetical protein